MTSGRSTKRARPEKPKVVLVMIVRDEAAIIGERLRAVRDQVDGWCIVDTGSVDETPRIVAEEMAGIEGELLHHEWHGFAHARTFAVRMAGHLFPGAFALLLDADTIFRAAKGWRSCLTPVGLAKEVQAISCAVWHGSIRYSHPRLLKLGTHEWRWRGVLHEYLEIPFGVPVVETELIHVEHGHGGARSRNPEKYRLDALNLRAAIEEIEQTQDHPDRDLLPRYAFYEAQSWRDAGQLVRAEAAYVERTKLGGFFQEVYLAWLNVGELRIRDGELAGAAEAFTRAWAADPSRAEAIIGLATICRTWEAWAPAYLYGSQAQALAPGSAGMFADQNVGWRADFEVSVAAWYVGKMPDGRAACERVLVHPLAPLDVIERTRANLELYQR